MENDSMDCFSQLYPEGFVESKPSTEFCAAIDISNFVLSDRIVHWLIVSRRHEDIRQSARRSRCLCLDPHQRMPLHIVDVVILSVILSFGSVALGYTRPYLHRQDLFGIWKLSHPHFKLPSSQDQQEDEVVVRLNEDGSFDPYTPIPDEMTTTAQQDNLQGILGRGGLWEYRDGMLLLAADRPKQVDPSQVHDTLFVGRLDVQVRRSISWDADSRALTDNDEVPVDDVTTSTTDTPDDVDVHLSVSKGTIDIGKFMYPKKHKAFFEEPMLFKRSNIGSFQMNQLLGNLNARLKKEREAPPKAQPLFRKPDFHNRSFYLTTAPHPVNPTFAELDIHYDEATATLDVRVMPITFHANNTFTANGVGKILRGRYDIVGENGDSLFFRVSLFGFGRSLSGSVYSEGRLLSQDDRRAYRGKIQSYEHKNHSRLFVEGEFYYGFGQETFRKSNSMGTFTLQEVDVSVNADEDDEESSLDEDDSIDTNSWDGSGGDFQ